MLRRRHGRGGILKGVAEQVHRRAAEAPRGGGRRLEEVAVRFVLRVGPEGIEGGERPFAQGLAIVEGRCFVVGGARGYLGLALTVALFHKFGEDLLGVEIGMSLLGLTAAGLEVGPQGVVGDNVLGRVVEDVMLTTATLLEVDFFVGEGKVDHDGC